MRNQTALFLGRFQPPNIAHIFTILAILEQWESLIIAVIYDSPKPPNLNSQWQKYIQESAISYAPEKNPISPTEVKEMWDAFITTRNLKGRIRCEITKRPYDLEFSKIYPPDQIDIVYPTLDESDPKIDFLRAQAYPKLLGREIFFVRPLFKLHNTEIKRIIIAGIGSWKDFVPSEIYEIFLRINGQKKFLE